MKTETGGKILEFIRKKGQTTPKEIISFIGFSAPAVFRQLKKLQDKGLIQKSGRPPTVFYYLAVNRTYKRAGNIQPVRILRFRLFQFGDFLTVREHAKEAFPTVKKHLSKNGRCDLIEIDFTGIKVLGPGWADEFLSPLLAAYPKKVVFLATDNASVKASLEFIDKH